MDNDGYLDVSNWKKHQVRQWKIGEANGRIVVDGNQPGNRANQLHYPVDLSFDRENNLYVVDDWNHRVQKFDINVNKSLSINIGFF
jgi:DNA-binding beta-propeller fold protein YncE